ncbi:universal stress protein [Halobacterium salinarum]|uniref:universal stress protein n=1 Tax=Halobacterium salinarum TaxID=2242 RepID=UPI001F1A454A|nr:universal stress protein [Halobacterium salinarum]MCF2206406.1 universal stress protein [Halobacterium salinarum]MCF2240036.1 universal stress protein [Halobacterium salinarum]
MYDQILLATDGTIASKNAESHAIELAEMNDATLHALFVVDESIYTAYSGDEYVDEAEGPEHGLEERGQEAIEEVRRSAEDSEVEMIEAVKHGHPVETILEYGDRQDIDMVVLGTKHRPAEYRALLGSVTERVLRLTTRPTVVVKTEVDE